jgi:hypothetical protein
MSEPPTKAVQNDLYWDAYGAGDAENASVLMGEGMVRDIRPASGILADGVREAQKLLAEKAPHGCWTSSVVREIHTAQVGERDRLDANRSLHRPFSARVSRREARMRFFFHIAGGEFFADPEGQEVPGVEEAREVARSIASDFAEVADGGRVEITDEHGKVVGVVPITIDPRVTSESSKR